MKTMRHTAPLLALLIGSAPLAGQALPADEDGALARLDSSPRHGEWIDYDAGDDDLVRAGVTYPERSDAAPVVVVIHEIYGLTIQFFRAHLGS